MLEDWITSDGEADYISIYRESLNDKYAQELGDKLYKLICQISILIYTKKNREEKKKLLKAKKIVEKEIVRMEDRKEYVNDLVIRKKDIGKRIREIDACVSDRALLNIEFEKMNDKLEKNKKIFSLSDWADILLNERKELMEELKNCSRSMDPMTYVKTKNDISEKVEMLKEINIEEANKDKVCDYLLLLQKEFLRAFESKIESATTKKEMTDYIYQFRYYKMLSIKKGKLVKEVPELIEDITRVEKVLISKACRIKVLTTLSNDSSMNFELVSKLLDRVAIDLDEIIVEFVKKKNGKTIFNIYEEDMIDTAKEYDGLKNLSVKYGRKVKLFI